MNLLLVTPFSAADWERMDALFDWHRALQRHVPTGHVLLAASPGTHAELRLKLKINAELSFASVTEFQSSEGKLDLFHQAARFVALHTRWPWLWLEPQCVPLCRDWIAELVSAYENQPMRCFGPFLKVGENRILGRTSIYPASAYNDLMAKRLLFPTAGQCKLIQFGNDPLKVRPDSVLFDGCKDDSLIESLRERLGVEDSPLIGSEADFKQVRAL